MSGGHFDYIQNHIQADVISRYEYMLGARTNPENYTNNILEEFSDETVDLIDYGMRLMKLANIYLHRIDYLVSGDEAEYSFYERLLEDLKEFK